MAPYPLARRMERLMAFLIDIVIITVVLFAIEAAVFGSPDYYSEMYGLSSYEYDDTEFSTMDLVGVPPYGPIASAAEENDQLAVAIVIADIMTGILSLEYLVCFECPTDVVVFTLLPYAVTLAYFAGMECAFMTTIGRRALRLRATGIDGERPSVRGTIISNIGKTFIPIIDVMLGLIFAREARQRIFSKRGGIIVVKVPAAKRDRKFELD